MKVYNKRTDKIPEDAIYVGRPSRWGNPFKIGIIDGRHIDRENVILLFRQYALAKLRIEPHWLDELKGKDLVCWCTPQKCHADILLELANK
jgi:hypothetical protein